MENVTKHLDIFWSNKINFVLSAKYSYSIATNYANGGGMTVIQFNSGHIFHSCRDDKMEKILIYILRWIQQQTEKNYTVSIQVWIYAWIFWSFEFVNGVLLIPIQLIIMSRH